MYSSQKEKTMQRLAEIILSVNIGEKIPTFSELKNDLEVGIGTIQGGLRDLEQKHLIKLTAKYRYGTILEQKDVAELWKYLPNRQLIGLFPEPLSLEMRGLAMGLREAFAKLGIPLLIVYGYGSKVRFQRILSEDTEEDFVISSLASAKNKQNEDQRLIIPMSFSNGSFYRNQSLLAIKRKKSLISSQDFLRVGVDRNSYDHMMLSESVFPKAEYIDINYSNAPFEVLENNIDAAIWHKTGNTELTSNSIFDVSLIDRKEKVNNLEEMSEAVLSVDKTNKLLLGLLEYIDYKEVLSVQQVVISGKLEPIF